jgi:serine/threonine protein kinase
MLLLKQTNTIHRDLKPANICLRQINDRFEVRFIDFGLAVNHDRFSANDSGTLLYMAPDKQTSHQSDIYALSAILAEVLGCPQHFLFKNKCTNLYNCENELYDFNHIFEGVRIPPDIDQSLLQDFKTLLNAMQSHNPAYRPPIDIVFKFLLLIPYRQAYTRTLLEKIPQIEQFKKVLNQTNSPLFESIKKEFAKIETNIKAPCSHYKEAISFTRANKLNSEYNDPYQLEKFDALNEKIQQWGEAITTLIKKEEHFNDSNSSGIPELFTILKSEDLSIIEKLDKLKSLGEHKTENTFSNWYSRSSFFGNGRHSNIELLYQRCANLSLDDPNNTLNAINSWESRMHTIEGFIHNRPII